MPKKLLYSLRDLKKCLGKTEVDFSQKPKTSILESEKFDFSDFFVLKVPRSKNSKFSKLHSGMPRPSQRATSSSEGL